MATVVALLDTLLTPSTDRVHNVYCLLKDILDVTVMQQVESSLQWQAEVSMSSPGHSKASQQRTVTELPMAGTASSPTQVLAHLWPGHQTGHLEPPVRRKPIRGMRARTPSTIRVTHATTGATTKKATISAPRG
jgi:hypothetical protein